MARLATTGGEFGEIASEIGSGVTFTLNGTAPTFDTTVKRSGTYSYKCNSGAGNTDSWVAWDGSFPSGRSYYARGYLLIPSATGYPTSSTRVVMMYRPGLFGTLQLELSTTGTLQLGWGPAKGNNPTGSPSAALALDTWYRVETRVKIVSGSADDEVEFLLDGVQVAVGTGLSIDTVGIGRWLFGMADSPGANKVVYWDDCAINDDQAGGTQTNWPGPGNVALLLPTSDNARGTWAGGIGGTTNLFNAINNVPPAGLSTETDTSQIENAQNTASASGDFNMTTYTAAGLASGGVARVVVARIVHAEDITTGTSTGSFAIVSNPVLGATTFTFGDDSATTMGNYPTGWARKDSAPLYDQSVTVGTAPVMRVTKTTASTKVGSVCQMAILVDYQPPGTFTPYTGTWTPTYLSPAARLWLNDTGLTGLVEGDQVSTWTDISGSGNHATQGTAADRPIYRMLGINNFPYVDFVSADRLVSNLESASTNATFLFVYDDNGSGTDQIITGASTIGAGSWHLGLMATLKLRGTESAVVDWSSSTASWPTTPSILGMSVNGTTSHEYHINGSSETQSHGSVSFSPPRASLFGANPSGAAPLQGRVYEIIATSYLSQADRERVEGYLAHKYAITSVLPGGHPYKTTPPDYLPVQLLPRILAQQTVYRM